MLADLLKKTDYNPKVSELESKIRSFSELATRAALIAVKNRTTNVSNLVKKKADYNTDISEIESKCITTTDYN